MVVVCVLSAACVGPPRSADWSEAAWDALTDASVWAPAAGAGLFLLDDFDQRATAWAVDHQPLFGSTDSAKGFSDRSAIGLGLFAGLSLFAVDHDAHPTILERDGVIALTALVGPGQLKNIIRRERPNENDKDSMPSGHATSSFAFASMVSHDLDRMPMLEGKDGAKAGLRALVYTVASASSWARVEAERHHPSDILLGAALGNFLTAFVNNLYAADHGGSGTSQLSAFVVPAAEQWVVGAHWRF
ncbi:MAG: membrane-associated phospholipid phosphatase [Pseudohongiellaceae bacterium]|jgi:membrane-associated phospholipid phosphatase